MTESEFNRIFSNNLLHYMEKYDISRAELAKRMKVSVTSVGFWCRGEKCPRMDKIDVLCDIFNCKRTDLLEEHTKDELSKNMMFANGKAYELPQELYDFVLNAIREFEIKKGANHNDR